MDFNCKVRNNTRLSGNFSVNAITRMESRKFLQNFMLSPPARELKFGFICQPDKGEPVLI